MRRASKAAYFSRLPQICFNELMNRQFAATAFGALIYFGCVIPLSAAEYEVLRQRMVREVIAASGNSPPGASIVAAMEKVERHRFVPAWLSIFAYRNHPLPIGHGQTISQPLIVARMTDLLKLKKDDKVLEIDTGSVYQAAVLAEIAKSVYTIIEPLGNEAARRFQSLGYDNVKTRIGDGYYGWPEAAPFDAILLTAAASHVPPPLLKQLKSSGRRVVHWAHLS